MNIRSLFAVILCSTAAFADFSYQQTSRVTGGAMAGMMKVAGAFSAKAREPMVSTVIVKGDRMATVTRDQIHVIDLGKETFTDINLEKKTYSVMTFAEMADLMKRAASRVSENKGDAEMQFKADVKETGQTKSISGFNTREFLVTLTMEGRDKKSGQTGGMDMQMDMWMAPSIAGYEEVRDFHRRMAEKLAWSPLASAAGPLAAQNSKGFAELAKQMSKLEGIPVLQVTRMGGTGATAANMPSEAEMQEAQRQSADAEKQRAEATDDARKNAAASALGGRLGRAAAIGGLGGFGRKKKTEEAPPPPRQQQTQTSQPKAGSSAPGALMEITTETTSFSSASVDTSKFEIPSGFKQVDSDVKKIR